MDLLIGIDGGGSTCRAVLATAAGEIVGRGVSGPSNIRTDLAGAAANIADAAGKALAEAGLPAERIGGIDALLGLAGTNVGDYAQRLEALLPFRRSRIESDATIALEGALGPHDGAIAVIGTGTVFLSRIGGTVRSVGGWGFMVGDLGGGARIGRQLLEEALLAFDRIRPASQLTDRLLDRFSRDPEAVVEFTTAAKPADYARLAPLVFAADTEGDPVAAYILATAVGHVSEALDSLALEPGQRLCVVGGLGELFAPRLPERHRAFLCEPLQDALGGALAMAMRHFGGKTARAKAG